MKRRNIELVLGFLDAIRKGDREAATAFLDPSIHWQGLGPDVVCHGPGEVIDVFLGQREQPIEVDSLELIGAQQGAVFAFHRPDTWEVAGIEIHGAIYHALAIEDGRIKWIEDCAQRSRALAAAGVANI